MITVNCLYKTVISVNADSITLQTKNKVKIIPLIQVKHIELTPPKNLSGGSISISLGEPNDVYIRTGFGAMALNSNTVVYPKREESLQAASFCDYVRDWSNEKSLSVSSIADEIAKLKQLFDSGALTEQEFELAKGRILS